MSAPTIDVTWDSNGTNTLGGGTTSGHKTDGYGVGEVPTSTELNTWMEGVGAWINYIRSPSAAWRWLQARGDLGSHMTRDATTGFYANTSNFEGKITGIPIAPAVGQVITSIGIDFTFGGSLSASDCTLKLYRTTLDGSAATLLATATFSSGSLVSGHSKFTQVLTGGNTSAGAAETVVDGSSYYFDVDLNTGASVNSVGVGAVGYLVQAPIL